MRTIPPPLASMIEAFEKLPGIGPRTAQRLSLHLLLQDRETMEALTHAMQEAKSSLYACPHCQSLMHEGVCELCTDRARDPRLLMVVESLADQLAIDESLAWPGFFFVLKGRLNPLQGKGPEHIGLDRLLRVVGQKCEGIFPEIDEDGHMQVGQRAEVLEEVVLATSYTPEGDATALFAQEALREAYPHLKVTRLPRGLPSGIEIEYTDLNTIASAVLARHTQG